MDGQKLMGGQGVEVKIGEGTKFNHPIVPSGKTIP